jgi:hypothetical protein
MNESKLSGLLFLLDTVSSAVRLFRALVHSTGSVGSEPCAVSYGMSPRSFW